MRALTMEELAFVSGGFLSENGEDPIIVTARRIPEGVDPNAWADIAGNEAKFARFCSIVSASHSNLVDGAAANQDVEDFAGKVAGLGLAGVAAGVWVCSTGTVISVGTLAVPSCSAGGVISFVSGVGAVGGGTVVAGNQWSQHKKLQAAMRVRTMAVSSGCDPNLF